MQKMLDIFQKRHDRIMTQLLWHISMTVRGTVSERVVLCDKDTEV